MNQRFVDANAKSWKTILDFYDEMLRSIRAPDWHGKNINALVDSIVYGGVNEVKPPYIIRLTHTDDLPEMLLRKLVHSNKRSQMLDQKTMKEQELMLVSISKLSAIP